MKLPLFGKKKSSEKKPEPQVQEVSSVAQTNVGVVPARNVLKHVYVSEKSTQLASLNQYVFKVAAGANKKEIAKQISRQYKVTVESVRVLNLPSKKRQTGRYPGVKAGYRKAIVFLAKGQSIEQAKA